MITSSSSGSISSLDLTDTTNSSDTRYCSVYDSYIKEKEVVEVREEILPLKVDFFKANNRNIVRQNRFSLKNKFRTHRTRNR